MTVISETEAERNARVSAWAATGAPARPDDVSVLAGRRLNRADVIAYLAQVAADGAAGLTDRDWSAWVTQLPPRST